MTPQKKHQRHQETLNTNVKPYQTHCSVGLDCFVGLAWIASPPENEWLEPTNRLHMEKHQFVLQTNFWGSSLRNMTCLCDIVCYHPQNLFWESCSWRCSHLNACCLCFSGNFGLKPGLFWGWCFCPSPALCGRHVLLLRKHSRGNSRSTFLSRVGWGGQHSPGEGMRPCIFRTLILFWVTFRSGRSKRIWILYMFDIYCLDLYRSMLDKFLISTWYVANRSFKRNF